VRSEPTASPLRTSLEELQGLPPALLITRRAVAQITDTLRGVLEFKR
jgi:hypothetical protein